MAYIRSGKTDNVIKHTQSCEYCGVIVTSITQTGLRPAMRRHLKEHHKAMYEKTMERGHYRNYPATSKPPEGVVTKDDGRHYLPCPYCGLELSSKRENLLPGMLTNHKRAKHEDKFIEEIATKKDKLLNKDNDEPLTEVAVAACFYPKIALKNRYPAPSKVFVPTRWQVDSVFVKWADTGFVAYRGRMGASEAWEVSK